MVTALGDTGHSTFMSPEMRKEESNLTQGRFEGIGAEVEMKNGNIVIVAPFDNSPAQRAGIRPGDIILKVDGQDVSGQSLGEVVSHILGPAGTKVTITVQHSDNSEVQDLTIQRAQIIVQNVTWTMLPGSKIAHIRIAAFSQGVTSDLQKALESARKAGATGVVLDLRNDPGGLLGEAVGVASQFLTSGNVLLEKDAQGNTQVIQVQPGGVDPDLPLVVLVNQGTASAAEIVSGALQDANRARLVGETTFGTGTVLDTFPLSDGSALLLATQEWLTPKGRVIWHQGIAPDVTLSLPSGQSILSPEAERGLNPQTLASSDIQLERAVQILSGTNISKGGTGGTSQQILTPLAFE
jgi:carboxyl-terminal processing protease